MNTKRFFLIGALAALLLGTGARLPAMDFDGGSGSLSGAVKDIKKQSESVKAPGISTASAPTGLAHFWENLKDDTADGLCKQAEIKLNQDGTFVKVVGLEGDFKRYMRKLPSEKVALIDEVGAKLSLNLGGEALNIPDFGSLGVSLTGALEGKSVVVRPLESDKYCRELKTLAKLYQVKTVLPATAKRITAMEVGEIWKLPLVMRVGFGASVGGNINEVLSVSFSAGKVKEKKPSVTLYRMDESRVRLRLRLDRVEAKTFGASVSTFEIPMEDLGLMSGEGLIAKNVNKAWAKEINKYLAFKLGYDYRTFSGKRLLLEFILDPNNPDQMAALEKFLQGDFGLIKRFIEMGLGFSQFSEEETGALGLGNIAGSADAVGQQLGAQSSFAGSNMYHGHSSGFNIQVPIIHSQNNSNTSTYNRYQSMGKDGETLHVQQEQHVANGSSLNIPFVGKTMKHDSERNVYVVNKESKDGKVTRPVMMYQQYEGYIKHGDGDARDMVGRANGVLQYVGANGNGVNLSNTIPAMQIFPQAPEETDADGFATHPSKGYRAAVMSFKLMINERGVQDIIFAPARDIMRAFMNVMRESEREIVDKVMDLFTIDKDGKVDYDYKAVQKRLGVSPFDNYENGTNPLDIVRTLARGATEVIKDIFFVKQASDWKTQSERLAKVSAGDSKSGLGYEDYLKVVVQLVNPADVSAEVYVHADKRIKGEPDVTQTYQYFNNRDNNFDQTLKEVNEMRDRFAEPSTLSD